MKRNSRSILKASSLVAVGIILARGAQATITFTGDTTITFDGSGFANNSQIPTGYGSLATTGAPAGVVVGPSGLGLGTPDVTLNWRSFSLGHSAPPIQFQYFQGGPNNWNGAELFNSSVGNTHELDFTVPSFAAVQLTSFNFQTYYNDAETFSYTVSVTDSTNPLNVLFSQVVNPPSNGLKDLVTLDVNGGLGQGLVLSITRSGGSGSPFNVAVDDVKFTEATPEPGTTALLGLGLAGLGWAAKRRKRA